jgi:hypothetical protein
VSETDRAVEPLDFDFSGVRLSLRGLPPALAERLGEEWRPYGVHGPGEAFLRLEIGYEEGDPERAVWAPKAMQATLGEESADFSMAEGRATIDASGASRVRMIRGLGPREYYTLVNLLRACLAWLLPSRGGVMLHAAGLVVEGRAFLLVGPEGSGKSTWVRLGQRAGARVLSDDVVLVDGAGPEPEALGSPLRSTYDGEQLRGRWPLAALLFPRHGRPALDREVSGLLARARLTANLPFIAEGVARDERIGSMLERLARSVPCADLTFGLDPGFLELLRRWTGG